MMIQKAGEIFHVRNLTPTSAVAESDDFLCDNRAPASNTKNGAFGNPLDVLVMCLL